MREAIAFVAVTPFQISVSGRSVVPSVVHVIWPCPRLVARAKVPPTGDHERFPGASFRWSAPKLDPATILRCRLYWLPAFRCLVEVGCGEEGHINPAERAVPIGDGMLRE